MEKIIYIKDQELTLKHYKEPLRKIPASVGYGYYGCVVHSKDGMSMMCHICGDTYKDLAKHIIVHATKKIPVMSAKIYRETFMLAKSTPLVSEHERLERKRRFVKWLSTLSEIEKQKWRSKQKSKMKEIAQLRKFRKQPKESLEDKNKKGTCPDQLLDKIQQAAVHYKRTPSKYEFIQYCESQRYVHLIYKTFGSWTKAIEMAGLKLHRHPKTAKTVNKYTEEELLEYLRIYTTENNQLPTATDFRMGLLPSYECYTRRWKTIEHARRAAGCHELLDS